MADEVRQISVVVQATSAVNNLVNLANKLDQLDGAVGSSDANLRKIDRTIDKATSDLLKNARAVAQLKGELKAMSKDLTAADAATGRLANRLTTAQKKLGVASEEV